MSNEWHLQDPEIVFSHFTSSPLGLGGDEVARRLVQHGRNEIKHARTRSPLRMFLDQFRDFMIIVLLGAAVVAGCIGEPADTAAILVIVLLNAVIGFVQQFRAEKALEALRSMAGTTATVVRSGVPEVVPAGDIVPGDVVMLAAGNIVPADIRLFAAADLRVDEASLTGESVPVCKTIDRLDGEYSSPGDRINMAFRGTSVTYGRASGVVTATGMDTELGKIAGLLEQTDTVSTPLQKRLTVFGKKLALIILAICVVVFLVGIARGEPVLLMLLTAISLAVAAIPEALPAVVTISLALGAKKLVDQQVLIRNLPAVETLGSVTYICSDKTGTLTENRMRVEKLFFAGDYIEITTNDQGQSLNVPPALHETWEWLLCALAISNDVHADDTGAMLGEPTEVALCRVAHDYGYTKWSLEARLPRIGEIPFEAQRRCMTTIHRQIGAGVSYVSFTKGALDALLPATRFVTAKEGIDELDVERLEKAHAELAASGMRVIGIGMRYWDSSPEKREAGEIECNLTLLGLAGIMDPPRPEASPAIGSCRRAGIEPVMITGDHPLTAGAIAQRLGFAETDRGSTMTGKELAQLEQTELAGRVEDIRVYARVAPAQKLSIVTALQSRGQFVAMTGDGVNDAPALKAADIGVAMGITGSDVAKQAADMILLDDNFATIVNAVRSGRRIFDNIRKFIKYTMTSNSGEIWAIFLAPLLGLPIPLVPIQILWINLVTDGLPGLALTAEPEEPGIMQRPPRPPGESIFSRGLGVHIVWVGLLMGGVTITTQAWTIWSGIGHWQTMTFTVLCLSQMGHVLAIRSESLSFFVRSPLTNKPLFGAVLLTFVLQMMVIYVPSFNPIFKTEALSPTELVITLLLSVVVFAAVEGEKAIRRRYAGGQNGSDRCRQAND